MEQLARLDSDPELRERLLPHCRLKAGDIWKDPLRGHQVAVGDAADPDLLRRLFADAPIGLLLNDPPYNISVGNRRTQALSRESVEAYLPLLPAAGSRRFCPSLL